MACRGKLLKCEILPCNRLQDVPDDADVTSTRPILYATVTIGGTKGSDLWTQADALTLQPGCLVGSGTLMWQLHAKASILRTRTGADVRVLHSLALGGWLNDAARCTGSSFPTPRALVAAALHRADFIFCPWHQGLHWSLLIICHPSAQQMCQIYKCSRAVIARPTGTMHAGRLVQEASSTNSNRAILLHMDSCGFPKEACMQSTHIFDDEFRTKLCKVLAAGCHTEPDVIRSNLLYWPVRDLSLTSVFRVLHIFSSVYMPMVHPELELLA